MTSYDFHGFTIDQALKKIDAILGHLILDKKEINIELITGTGPLQAAITKYLNGNYDLDYRIYAHNLGALYITLKQYNF